MNIIKKILEIFITVVCFTLIVPGLILKAIGFAFNSIGLLFTESTKYIFTGADCLVNFNCEPDRFERF